MLHSGEKWGSGTEHHAAASPVFLGQAGSGWITRARWFHSPRKRKLAGNAFLQRPRYPHTPSRDVMDGRDVQRMIHTGVHPPDAFSTEPNSRPVVGTRAGVGYIPCTSASASPVTHVSGARHPRAYSIFAGTLSSWLTRHDTTNSARLLSSAWRLPAIEPQEGSPPSPGVRQRSPRRKMQRCVSTSWCLWLSRRMASVQHQVERATTNQTPRSGILVRYPMPIF